MAPKYLDINGLLYFWGKLKSYYQEKLVSGTNIKTVNNNSLLGSGNIDTDNHVELTQAEYDQLSSAEKNNGNVYFITDGVPDTLVVNDTVPIGAIQAYGGATAPANWLLCDGSAVSRATYSELFAAIGTTYGTGDGSTTFNVPDLKGRVIVGVGESSATGHTVHALGQSDGEETHVLSVNEMPSHTHEPRLRGIGSFGNALDYIYQTGNGGWYPNSDYINSTGGDQPHNNMQPYVVTNYIIKAKDYERGVTPISGLIATDVGATDPSGDPSNVQAELDALNDRFAPTSISLHGNTYYKALRSAGTGLVIMIPLSKTPKTVSFSSVSVYVNSSWIPLIYNGFEMFGGMCLIDCDWSNATIGAGVYGLDGTINFTY